MRGLARKIRETIAAETRRHKTRFWGRTYIITPRLLEWIHGDGLQIIWFAPLNTRPNYYVARIDSRVSLNNSDDPCFADDVLDELSQSIEEQFGYGIEEWKSDKNGRTYRRHNPFPALNDDCGSSWGLIENFGPKVKAALKGEE